MAETGYRPEIDGLRAFAIIPVILFHMGVNLVPGGYIGVDVFFVISGFLITSIVKKELDLGTFSFPDFWARRIRRILPAMVFVTAATLAVTYAFVYRPDQQVIGMQALAALLSVANIYFWRNTGDYWGKTAEESPFLHAWSLSLEEQFYLFFPVTMWVIFRFRSHWLQGCILSAVVGSLALFLWGSQAHPTATFYLLPTRVWELGTGCLLALSLSGQSAKTRNFGVFASIGLCMVVVSYLFIDKPNGGLGLAVVGTALVIAFGETGLCNKVLCQCSVVHIGKISYSLYLWHWPIAVLAEHLGIDWPGISDKALLVGATYFLAFATYRLIEMPTRRRTRIIPAIALCYFGVVAFAAAVAIFPRHYDTRDFNQPTYYENYTLQPDSQSEFFESQFKGWNLPERESSPDAFLKGGMIVGRDPEKPEIVVLGDSMGVMWSNTIRSVTERLDITTSFYSASGVSPFVELPLREGKAAVGFSAAEKLQYDKARLECIRRWQPKLVIVCCAWSRCEEADTHDLMKWLDENVPHVLFVEQPPVLLNVDRNDCLQYLISRGVEPKEGTRQYWPSGICGGDNVDRGRMLMGRLSEKYQCCDIIRIHDLYYDDGNALVLDGKDVVYLDFLHLSEFGARLARHRIEQAIAKIFAK